MRLWIRVAHPFPSYWGSFPRCHGLAATTLQQKVWGFRAIFRSPSSTILGINHVRKRHNCSIRSSTRALEDVDTARQTGDDLICTMNMTFQESILSNRVKALGAILCKMQDNAHGYYRCIELILQNKMLWHTWIRQWDQSEFLVSLHTHCLRCYGRSEMPSTTKNEIRKYNDLFFFEGFDQEIYQITLC